MIILIHQYNLNTLEEIQSQSSEEDNRGRIKSNPANITVSKLSNNLLIATELKNKLSVKQRK